MFTMFNSEAPALSLVLNTWFLLRLHEANPRTPTFGGLPNDFLTKGAASLLIVDHVVCDEDGFLAETAMPWVSSHIFRTLHSEGLLRPSRLREEYSLDVQSRLERTGLLEGAREFMRMNLARINRGEVATEALTIPPSLRWLNSVMFMGIDLPNTLHYDYHDNHFGNLSLDAQVVLRDLAPAVKDTSVATERSARTSRLVDALSIALPDFSLLPPVIGEEARAALVTNIEAEKRMMYRYLYGDMTHPEFEKFRSGDEFRRRDLVVDSIERFREADENLQLLLRVRSATKGVRPDAQRAIASVVDGTRSLDEVRSELWTIRSTIDDALEREARIRDMRLLAGVHGLLGAAEMFAMMHGHFLLGGAAVLKSGLEAVRELHEASELREHLEALGRRFPLAWIAGVHLREKNRTRMTD